MDKLKQVQKFQFWILLGIALILPLVGWTMATSGLVSEAEGRTKLLTDLKESLKTTEDDPNKDWETGLEVINVDQGKQPKLAHTVLYERQLPLMTWPSKMPNDSAKFQTQHQEHYRTTAYRQLVEEVRKIVKPYDEETQTGLVIYPEELLPTPDWEGGSQAPSVKQIEAAQEDLWLLAALLKQIAAVNEDATTPFEAPIRQINELYLRGGSKAAAGGGSKTAATAPTTGGGAKGAMANADMMKGMSASGAGRGGMGGGGRNAGGDGATAITSPTINPDDDLGAEQAAASDKPAEPKSSTKTLGGMEKMMSMGSSGSSSLGGSGSGSSARWSGSNMGRYRDDKPEYRTRGFYIEVVMDHRYIPELLAALANADWPINILHVQEADFKNEDLADAGGGGAGLSSMGAPVRSTGSGLMIGARGGMPGMGGAPPGMNSSAARLKGGPGRSSDDSGVGSMNNRSALDDPKLANVAIVGVIYIFKKPVEKPGATSPASTAPGVVPSPVASVPATSTPGTTAGDPSKAPSAATHPAASEADSGTAADDDTTADQADPAAAAPENKPVNKPEEVDTPVKEDSPEKAPPEKTGPGKS